MTEINESIADDGLIIPEVGSWSEQKYRLIGHYARLFGTGMKNLWDSRVYIDLYSGSGLSRIRGSGRIVKGSPLLAVDIPDPFDLYVFCDAKQEYIEALRKRVSNNFPGVESKYIPGDVNRNIDKVLRMIPPYSRTRKVLSLCIVDPYNASNFSFSSIKQLSKIFVDFLILIPSYMQFNRFAARYTAEESQMKILDRYLGTKRWSESWERAKTAGMPFGEFVCDEFAQQMNRINFLGTVEEMSLVRGDDKQQPLYHMAFFSKSRRGMDFWKKTLRGTNPQTSFSW